MLMWLSICMPYERSPMLDVIDTSITGLRYYLLNRLPKLPTSSTLRPIFQLRIIRATISLQASTPQIAPMASTMGQRGVMAQTRSETWRRELKLLNYIRFTSYLATKNGITPKILSR